MDRGVWDGVNGQRCVGWTGEVNGQRCVGWSKWTKVCGAGG